MIWIVLIQFVLLCFLCGIVYSQIDTIKKLESLIDIIRHSFAVQLKKRIRDDNNVEEKTGEKENEEKTCEIFNANPRLGGLRRKDSADSSAVSASGAEGDGI